MNILIFNCSPVKTGATAFICDYVCNILKNNNNVKVISIDDYKINYCKGCRSCHKTAKCIQEDDVTKIINEYDWADKIISVSPSYWADVPGQFKSFIDRCTPWSNTHEPHAKLKDNKLGYNIVLRTGPNMKELERLISTLNHFYGHMRIEAVDSIGLCSIEYKSDLLDKLNLLDEFCQKNF